MNTNGLLEERNFENELHHFILEKNIEEVSQYFLNLKDKVNLKAIINHQDKRFLVSPLILASLLNNEEMIKILLKERDDLDLNLVDHFGCSALHHAAVNENLLIIDLLLKYGANEGIKNKYGGTYKDLQSLINPKIQSNNSKVNSKTINFKNEKEITFEELNKLCGCEILLSDCILTKREWYKMWIEYNIQEEIELEEWEVELQERYNLFRSSSVNSNFPFYLDHQVEGGYFLRSKSKIGKKKNKKNLIHKIKLKKKKIKFRKI